MQGLGSGLLVLWLRSPNNNSNNARNVNNDGNINNNVNNDNIGVRPDFNPQGTSWSRVYADCLCGILKEHRGRVQD